MNMIKNIEYKKYIGFDEKYDFIKSELQCSE